MEKISREVVEKGSYLGRSWYEWEGTDKIRLRYREIFLFENWFSRCVIQGKSSIRMWYIIWWSNIQMQNVFFILKETFWRENIWRVNLSLDMTKLIEERDTQIIWGKVLICLLTLRLLLGIWFEIRH